MAVITTIKRAPSIIKKGVDKIFKRKITGADGSPYKNVDDLGSFPNFLAVFNLSLSAFRQILYEIGSISTKSTLAPQYLTQLALATKEIGDVHTISPFPTPNAKQLKWSALVALTTAAACLTPQ